jgi:zinc protease
VLWAGLNLCFLLVAVVVVSPRSVFATDWPPVAAGIEVDASIVWGELPNGFRYALKHQPFPAGKTSLRFVVLAGSLHENEDEIGIAHFVEHMGFNGTKKFRHELLGEELEKEGIRFGPEVTAFTWPSHTIYQLDLPSSDAKKMDLGLTVIREWASEMRIDRSEVNREKGVIISEARSRGLNATMLGQNRLKLLYPQSRLSQRPAVTNAEQINSVTRDRLRDFYTRWYRPDNAFLVIAGDFDPAQLEPQIAKKFSSWKRPTSALPKIEIGPIHNDSKPRAQLVVNEEIKTFNLELTLVESICHPQSVADRKRSLALSLGLNALQNRLNALHRNNPTIFGRIGVLLSTPTPYAWEVSLQAEGRVTDWQFVTQTVLDEYRRLRQFGFLEEELIVPRIDALKQAEFATRHAITEPAESFASRTAQSLIWGHTPTSVAFNHALATEALPTIDAAACLAALRPFFAEGFPSVIATTDPTQDLPTAEFATFLNEAIKQPVSPPEPPEKPEFPYTDFGAPGEITKHVHDESIDLHMLQFANGVRLNLKATDFNAGTISLRARLDNGGVLRQPDNKLGLVSVAQGAFIEGGLAQLDAEQLKNSLAGRFAQLGFSIGENATIFTGSADTEELTLLFQMLTAFLTDFELREESINLAKQALLSWQGLGFVSIDHAISIQGRSIYYPNDSRFALVPETHINALDPVEIKAWLKWTLTDAPMEIALVGDYDIEQAIKAAAATVGTLPRREPPSYFTPVNLRSTGIAQGFKVESTEQKRSLVFAWPVHHLEIAQRRRTLEISSWVLRAKIIAQIREKLGIAYTPDTNHWISEADPSQGFLQISLSVDFSATDRAVNEVIKITQHLAKKGISADDLARAKEPVIQNVAAQLKSNGYWLQHVAGSAQTNPESVTLPHSRLRELQNITAAEVDALFREVFVPENQILLFTAP